MTKQSKLSIRGCRHHNLQDISIEIPKQKIVSVVGVSGSGKSSLVFDTIHAEGQRRYLESLSPANRQWIKQLPKPDCDLIDGLSPSIAVNQAMVRIHPRATVATHTDIYDFLSLLYSNCADQYSPKTNKLLRRYSRQEIIEHVLTGFPEGSRLQILANVPYEHGSLEDTIARLQKQGFIRLRLGDLEFAPEDPIPANSDQNALFVVVDRIAVSGDIRERVTGSIETALDLGRGSVAIQEGRDGPIHYLPEIYVCPETGYSFAPLQPRDFNFNSVHGACPTCQGMGGADQVNVHGLCEYLSGDVLDRVASLLDRFPKTQREAYEQIWELTIEHSQGDPATIAVEGSLQPVDLKTRVGDTNEMARTTWKGLKRLIDEAMNTRQGQLRFSGYSFVDWQRCPSCDGGRLKQESLHSRIGSYGIHEFCSLSVDVALEASKAWRFEGRQQAVAKEILPQILERLEFLASVGLGYLELDRLGTTLSQGEAQRVQLTAQIGAKLSGIIYILDEPSLGLHPADTIPLAKLIQELQSLGNTILLVEHNPELIRIGDRILELGPGAGADGGKLTYDGSYSGILKSKKSITAPWLTGEAQGSKTVYRKPTHEMLSFGPVSCHNLRNLTLKLPLNCLVGVCGVSGSGKSTLISELLQAAVHSELNTRGSVDNLHGSEVIQRVVSIAQGEAGMSPRSTPATYVGLMTPLRKLFAQTKLAQARGYTAARFSLNKKGGRCDACEGQGQIRVGMQFLPDVYVPCDLCDGKRFNFETLQVTWQSVSFADILDMPARDALELFRHHPELEERLGLMVELGLGYLTLGQSFVSLSGGERQRLRLVADLAKKQQAHTLYILDEPCSGLHFEDADRLGVILNKLVDAGHSVVFIEHHLHLLTQADWCIELGPGGGPNGGQIIFEGTPQDLKKADTPTGRCL